MSDLYIIELKDKIKIGKTSNFETRLKSITHSGGITKKEILKTYLFKECGNMEQHLLKLTEHEKVIGEWRNKDNAIIDKILEYVNKNNTVDLALIEIIATISRIPRVKAQYFSDENFLNIASQIYAERKNVGHSPRGRIKYTYNEKSISYRNWKYDISIINESFTRKPLFAYEEMELHHQKECIRMILNRIVSYRATEIAIEYVQNLLSFLFGKGKGKPEMLENDIKELIIFSYFSENLNDKDFKFNNFENEELAQHTHTLATSWYYSLLSDESKINHLNKIREWTINDESLGSFIIKKTKKLESYIGSSRKDSHTELFLEAIISSYFLTSPNKPEFTKDDWMFWADYANL